ncbi:Sb-PDE family phosphodiesterase [Pelagicoccus mobilis]|uniref:Polymerase/histidinol phosphatase N-terminal domain-containing protein n=1 Tax=Pelagicoccus mobilis TaxID=415221 RepID=A0A934S031_9BACT|nr:Sb-PDE family phosphodiesterase [Pelagicoccus mobilis]MBK1879902.1 hypothetical protein [Pelagicoccus mobilis]
MIRLLSSVTISIFIGQLSFGHGSASKHAPDEARKIDFPDTAHHKTLVLDPHTHSVFSDGHVWPRIRISEAIRDGLDAIAITEHLEYQPHINDIPHPDRNKSYEEAASSAKYSNLLVIPGAEITRSLPASHMNALFIQDANKLLSVPETEASYTPNEFSSQAKAWPPQNAVDAANEQGAFLFWNHAWWRTDYPNGIPEVSDFHKRNIEAGLLHGIEIANGKHYSEDAFQIALDNNLTLIGASDVHDLIDWDYEPHKGGHRPVTLVFANEKSTDSLKEALFDRRTVVWFKNSLIGRDAHLYPLLEASLSIKGATYRYSEILAVTIVNTSDCDFQLRNLSPYGLHERTAVFTVPQHSSQTLQVRTGTKVESISLEFEVLNAYTAPNQTATLTLESTVTSLPSKPNP